MTSSSRAPDFVESLAVEVEAFEVRGTKRLARTRTLCIASVLCCLISEGCVHTTPLHQETRSSSTGLLLLHRKQSVDAEELKCVRKKEVGALAESQGAVLR